MRTNGTFEKEARMTTKDLEKVMAVEPRMAVNYVLGELRQDPLLVPGGERRYDCRGL